MTETNNNYSLLNVTIKSGDFELNDVLCKVYLPHKHTDKILVHLLPTEHQMRIIRAASHVLWRFSIKGEIRHLSQVAKVIQADKVYSIDMVNKYWGDDVVESVVYAEATDLRVIQYLPRESDEQGPKTESRLWLTPHVMLPPFKIINRFPDGNVRVETLRAIRFRLENGVHLTFKTQFVTKKNEDDDSVTSSKLVAEFELEGKEAGAIAEIDESLTNQIDDFLLIASFAARQRCIWFGWESFGPGMWTTFHRRGVTMPKTDPRHNVDDGVIDIAQFEEFLAKAYVPFVGTEPKEFLRNALRVVIPKQGEILENHFLALYSSVESLVLDFRRKAHLEFVLPPKDWRKVQRELKRWLSQHPGLKNQSDKAALMNEKLPELNRISFTTAFEKFCEEYSVALNDLWPLTDNADGWSLSRIRNKLIHGEPLTPVEVRVLSTASIHLQWTLERLILGVLGWDASRSKVSSDYLPHMTAYNEWKDERKLVSN